MKDSQKMMMECERCHKMMMMKGDKAMMDKMGMMKCPMCGMEMKKMDMMDPAMMKSKMMDMKKSMEDMK